MSVLPIENNLVLRTGTVDSRVRNLQLTTCWRFVKMLTSVSEQQQELLSEVKDLTVETKKSVKEVDLANLKSKKEEQPVKMESKPVSTKIQNLRTNKNVAKTRLTKVKKQLNALIEKQLPGVPLSSKNVVRRVINKINSEMNIVEKIICGLKEIYAVNAENEETFTVIEILGKELEDIGDSVDLIIISVEIHLEQRLDNGEAKSVLISLQSQEWCPVFSGI